MLRPLLIAVAVLVSSAVLAETAPVPAPALPVTVKQGKNDKQAQKAQQQKAQQQAQQADPSTTGAVPAGKPVAAAKPPTPTGARCLIENKQFSPGAAIRIGGTVMACGLDGVWTARAQAAGGCFFADVFYTVGATLEVPPSKSYYQVCMPDGAWRVTEDPVAATVAAPVVVVQAQPVAVETPAPVDDTSSPDDQTDLPAVDPDADKG